MLNLFPKRAAWNYQPASPNRRRKFAAKGSDPKHPHHSGRMVGGPSFKAGDTVRETGIYEVIHDRMHREHHEAVMLAGDTFPACETCDRRVRFRLVRTAPYIFQDEDFENPEG
jgi:hypothetical protein